MAHQVQQSMCWGWAGAAKVGQLVREQRALLEVECLHITHRVPAPVVRGAAHTSAAAPFSAAPPRRKPVFGLSSRPGLGELRPRLRGDLRTSSSIRGYSQAVADLLLLRPECVLSHKGILEASVSLIVFKSIQHGATWMMQRSSIMQQAAMLLLISTCSSSPWRSRSSPKNVKTSYQNQKNCHYCQRCPCWAWWCQPAAKAPPIPGKSYQSIN